MMAERKKTEPRPTREEARSKARWKRVFSLALVGGALLAVTRAATGWLLRRRR